MPATAPTVSLTGHQQKFLESQVSACRHGSTSEAVREALRRHEDDIVREQAHLDYLRRLGDKGEAEFARGEFETVELDRLGEYLSSLGRE
jgi:putative addiction module CopG family antidote